MIRLFIALVTCIFFICMAPITVVIDFILWPWRDFELTTLLEKETLDKVFK